MLSWIIIGVIVVLAIFILKINHVKHRFWVVLLVLIALFLYLSITIVHNKYNLDFTTASGIFNSVKVYSGWLVNGFHNVKALGGNAIKMDWTSSDVNLFNKTNNSLPAPDLKPKK